ncbi:hypothetical protein [Yinghuangia seranimata]|uniref:hypothetical protein n=1 Tax=Yinghuangia seranimata TaxID=408067 RepID=UPI00248CA021|nr:hypothetical protein [Yinghuangia seranimata]MDI2124612.1 hypothetical protein [Yinghuangia seranimata]
MGLVLYPADGDTGSPDVSWSYRGFDEFRRRLAHAEGFDLDAMYGFGGDRPWNEVATALEPLLDHPDVGGADLSPAQCAAVLARLEVVADAWAKEADPLVAHHVEDARGLARVLRFCVDRSVPLGFL